jgi:hypothetical protein
MEVGLLLVVTHHAISTPPEGFENSGELFVPIATLAVVQFVAVAILARGFGRLFPVVRRERSHGSFRWSGILGLAGMVITCGAFAFWSVSDGTTLVVNTNLISGVDWTTNVGAWWPGLFAGMAALAIVALACAPSITQEVRVLPVPVDPGTRDVPRALSSSPEAQLTGRGASK